MNTAKTAGLMILLTALFVLIGYWIGGQGGMISAFLLRW